MLVVLGLAQESPSGAELQGGSAAKGDDKDSPF